VEDRGLARLDARSSAAAAPGSGDPTGDDAAARVGDPAFWAAVRALPERQAACVALHYLEDRSVADIAEVLGCRAATVKVHLHRGRTALARTLAAVDGGVHRRTTDDLGEEAR
jgi:RNA polymerase sigma-70 factor (ECF subfamily)